MRNWSWFWGVCRLRPVASAMASMGEVWRRRTQPMVPEGVRHWRVAGWNWLVWLFSPEMSRLGLVSAP